MFSKENRTRRKSKRLSRGTKRQKPRRSSSVAPSNSRFSEGNNKGELSRVVEEEVEVVVVVTPVWRVDTLPLHDMKLQRHRNTELRHLRRLL
jgi:hypothetical protein